MASFKDAREAPAKQLWDEIDGVHAGMLGVENSGLLMQPMAPQTDRKTNNIWFYTKTDAELVKAIKPGSRANFCLVGKDHDYHASIAGQIEVRKDAAKIDEFWNSVVAAWYEDGKNDPSLTMLALHIDDAEVWASTDSTLKFGWEIAKANLNDQKTPDVGVNVHLRFA